MTKGPENHSLAHTDTLFVKGEARGFRSGEREREAVLGFLTGTFLAWETEQVVRETPSPMINTIIWPASHRGSQNSHHHHRNRLPVFAIKPFGLGGEVGRIQGVSALPGRLGSLTHS